MSLILEDMDGVLVDWGHGWDTDLARFGAQADNIPRHIDQRSFNLKDGLEPHEQDIVDEVMNHMNYATLRPIPGAVEAIHSMLEYGHDVMICTSPWTPNRDCIPGKQAWVEEHLGLSWVDRMVITKDKTVMLGDFLIDDKPNITGRAEPRWQQVIFDQPYNREVTNRPRLRSWDDWKNEEYR